MLYMSMKSFLMRKMLASKMKGVPQAEQDKIFDMIEKNPDFFQKIGLEIQILNTIQYTRASLFFKKIISNRSTNTTIKNI
jgi:hypothetical protein